MFMRILKTVPVVAALVLAAVLGTLAVSHGEGPSERFEPSTRIKIVDGFWEINGTVTYRNTPAEGLLMNARMANAVFDDLNPKTRPEGFDADVSTARFVRSIPSYTKLGIRGFSINLQGGDPGYEGAVCSAYEKDGTLREAAMRRVAMVVEGSDRYGVVVILGLFSRHQDQTLEDEKAVQAAVENVLGWIASRGYANVLVEIADQYMAEGWDHEVFKSPDKMGDLVTLAKKRAPGILVSSTRQGTGRIDPPVGNASDYLSTHFTGLPVDMIPVRTLRVMVYSKPIVCTADFREEKTGAAVEATVNALCSYGVATKKTEHYPFDYRGADDAPEVYKKIAELTGSTGE